MSRYGETELSRARRANAAPVIAEDHPEKNRGFRNPQSAGVGHDLDPLTALDKFNSAEGYH